MGLSDMLHMGSTEGGYIGVSGSRRAFTDGRLESKDSLHCGNLLVYIFQHFSLLRRYIGSFRLVYITCLIRHNKNRAGELVTVRLSGPLERGRLDICLDGEMP